MYALLQHAQHLCSRFLTLACPGFLTVADIKGNVGATRDVLETRINEWIAAQKAVRASPK
jgi:hypothetical protein